jgi:hypothetical protein
MNDYKAEQETIKLKIIGLNKEKQILEDHYVQKMKIINNQIKTLNKILELSIESESIHNSIYQM